MIIRDLKTIDALEKRGFTIDEKTGKVDGFNANFFARYIEDNLDILYSKDGYFYIYKDGVWKKHDVNDIYKLLRDILQEPRYGVWSRRIEN